MDLVARLAALASNSGVHLTGFHGTMQVTGAEKGNLCAQVIPAKRCKTNRKQGGAPAARHAAMAWAHCLKHFFSIGFPTCEHCGGAVRISARND